MPIEDDALEPDSRGPSHKKRLEQLPTLGKDRSFWGMAITQFLGAFNDNLYKQLMLLLAVPVGAAALSSDASTDKQDVVTILFSLPFVVFSPIAGFVSDRFSKSWIIQLSKFAEIAAMGLGMAAFLFYGVSGYSGLLLVLFLMGLQSTFFGPGKYGILPELFRATDLPRANGIIMMTTFLAILFGTVAAGFLGDTLIDNTKPLAASAPRLWIGSAICIGIAIVGSLTALMIRFAPPAQPNLKLTLSSWGIPREIRDVLWNDTSLTAAILASSVFWMVSGIAIQAVNSLGLVQLGLSKTNTSIMAAIIGLGIAIGGVLAGRLSQGRANPKVIRAGLWGLLVTLLTLSISLPVTDREPLDKPVTSNSLQAAESSPEATPNGPTLSAINETADAPQPNPTESQPDHSNSIDRNYRHLLGFGGSLPVLAVMGIAAAMFAIPLQVFVQSRPPDALKGRMIAVMNQANFVAILLSGVVYGLFDRLVIALDWPRSPIFAMMSLLVLPVLICYRPTFEDRGKQE